MTELAVIAGQTDPFPVLVARWLAEKDSEGTRKAYRAEIGQWTEWCRSHDGHPLTASRAAVAAYNRELDGQVANVTRARKLSVLSSFYAWCVANDHLPSNPVAGLKRPTVDWETAQTPGLSKDQVIALLAAADAYSGPERLRTSALVALLVYTGIRISEALGADIEDLGQDRGHRVLKVTRKGGKKAAVALPPPVADRMDAYLASRPDVSTDLAVRGDAGSHPRRVLFATASGARMDRRAAHRLIGRVAEAAGIPADLAVHPHTLRSAFVTMALDNGSPLRDVQDAAGHASPATTRRYDRSRNNLDRSPGYGLAAYLGK